MVNLHLLILGGESDLRLSRSELLESSGLSDEQFTQVESFGLINIRGRYYDADALSVARTIAQIATLGSKLVICVLSNLLLIVKWA